MLGINRLPSEVCTLAKVFEVAMLIYFEFQLKDGAHELHCWGFVAKGLRVSYKR